MVRCDGNGRLCEQDDRRPKQDAGWDGREGEASNFDLTFASKVGMLFRFIATGIGGFVYPFTQVEIQNRKQFLFFCQNWLLSLVLLTVVPAMAVMGGIIGKIMTAAAKDEMDIYGKVQKSPFDCMTV